MMLNAPRDVSLRCLPNGRRKVVTPPNGVCRFRMGVDKNGATIDEKRASTVVDVLAIGEAALRQVVFLGEPLGAAGSAVALRQAKALKLDAPMDTALHGRVLKLFVRADVIRAYMLSSPTIARLLTVDDNNVGDGEGGAPSA